MSSSLYLIPYGKSNLQIEPNGFIEALQHQWPNVEINFISDTEEGFILEWNYTWSDGSKLIGLLDIDLKGIALSGSGADIGRCAEFGLWLQKLYPEAKNILFFDEQTSFDIIIDGRTVDEIVQLAQNHYSYTDLLEENRLRVTEDSNAN